MTACALQAQELGRLIAVNIPTSTERLRCPESGGWSEAAKLKRAARRGLDRPKCARQLQWKGGFVESRSCPKTQPLPLGQTIRRFRQRHEPLSRIRIHRRFFALRSFASRMHRLKNASRAAMTRSKLKQPNYSLSRIAILATLSKESREKLEQRCAWRRYERGEPIVDYLDASDDVFFIAFR